MEQRIATLLLESHAQKKVRRQEEKELAEARGRINLPKEKEKAKENGGENHPTRKGFINQMMKMNFLRSLCQCNLIQMNRVRRNR